MRPTPQLPHPQLEQSPLHPQEEHAHGPILIKEGFWYGVTISFAFLLLSLSDEIMAECVW